MYWSQEYFPSVRWHRIENPLLRNSYPFGTLTLPRSHPQVLTLFSPSITYSSSMLHMADFCSFSGQIKAFYFGYHKLKCRYIYQCNLLYKCFAMRWKFHPHAVLSELFSLDAQYLSLKKYTAWIMPQPRTSPILLKVCRIIKKIAEIALNNALLVHAILSFHKCWSSQSIWYSQVYDPWLPIDSSSQTLPSGSANSFLSMYDTPSPPNVILQSHVLLCSISVSTISITLVVAWIDYKISDTCIDVIAVF